LKVMFVCSGGMSTAMTAKKLEEISARNGNPMSVVAYGTSDYQSALEKEAYDVVLVAPQIRHRYDTIVSVVNKFDGVRCGKIPPQMYAPMEPAVKKLYEFIVDLMKEN